MSRKIIIAVFSFVVLIACYKIEQKVYRSRTYYYYKMQNSKDEKVDTLTWQELSEEENLQLQVEKENEKVRKIAYLTFDDGPSDVTETILKILKENQIKATFFLVGNEITPEREEVLMTMVEQGHTIGIHTYSHKREEIYSSADAFVQDMEKAYLRIYEVTDLKVKIYRFPWGSVNCYLNGICEDIIHQMQERGFTYYDWNVSGEDALGKPTEHSILYNVEKDAFRFSEPVVLLHDGKMNAMTAKILPKLIQDLKEEGYEFDVVTNRSRPYQYNRK